MKLSILVALRDDSENQHRQHTWDVLSDRYARLMPGAEIVVAADDGEDPFHKTVALNRAASLATGDVFMITDADTWVSVLQILEAMVAMSVNPSWWGRPWNRKVKLLQLDSIACLNNPDLLDDQRVLDRAVERPRSLENINTYWGAPPTLVRREHFYRVGGMDERFRGWGQEDEAFCLALRTLVAPPKHLVGVAIHLWHPRLGRSGFDRWPGEVEGESQNIDLVKEYKRCVRYPDRMERLVRERTMAV